jgi:hypothetical protein
MSALYFAKGARVPKGDWCRYKKTTIVPMLKMNERFTCESREGTLTGEAGDFLVEDGHGGFYPVSAEFHAANYEEAS